MARIIMNFKLVYIFILTTLLSFAFSFPSREDLMSNWCGDSTCYDVMSVQKDSSMDEINKAYKKLAIKYHPDKNRENIKEAEAVFQKITYAYTIIGNEAMRERYDEVQRIKAKLHVPKENPFFVAVFLMLCGASLQYYFKVYMHRVKRHQMLSNEAVRRRLKNKMLQKGKNLKIRNNEIEEEIPDETLFEIVSELNIKLPADLKEKPKFFTVLKRFPLQPLYLLARLWFAARIYVKGSLLKKPLSEQDKIDLTIKALNITYEDWSELTVEKQNRLIKKQLWVKEEKKKTNKKKDK